MTRFADVLNPSRLFDHNKRSKQRNNPKFVANKTSGSAKSQRAKHIRGKNASLSVAAVEESAALTVKSERRKEKKTKKSITTKKKKVEETIKVRKSQARVLLYHPFILPSRMIYTHVHVSVFRYNRQSLVVMTIN